MRYLRVRDHAEKVVFCPTGLMRADPLSKLECSVAQRNLLLLPYAQVSNQMKMVETYDEDDDVADVDLNTFYAVHPIGYNRYMAFYACI